ncbi:hypothetical protein [Flagellimonas marinaquae]
MEEILTRFLENYQYAAVSISVVWVSSVMVVKDKRFKEGTRPSNVGIIKIVSVIFKSLLISIPIAIILTIFGGPGSLGLS